MTQTLKDYLIPDLSDMVLEYCWPVDEVWKHVHTCVYGHYEMLPVDSDIFKGEYGERALYLAAGAGYIKLVELLLDKGAKDQSGAGLYAACKSGCAQIVELMLKQERIIRGYRKNWYRGTQEACGKGHAKIVHLMMKHFYEVMKPGVPFADYLYFHNLLKVASQGGHKNIVDIMEAVLY